MKKIGKRIISIIIILAITIMLYSTTCYAAEKTIQLTATNDFNRITSEINGKLSIYGYKGAIYDMEEYNQRTFIKEWTKNDLNYTASITIIIENRRYSRVYSLKFNHNHRNR